MMTAPGLPNHPNLHPKEVAAFLRVNVTWVYDQIQQRNIPGLKVGAHYRIPRDKFLQWYEYQQQQLSESI